MRKPIDLETITLARGSHTPDGIVCVMELASQLANEDWSDSPKCASPVIAQFLRSWNDALDDGPRQMLKPYALKVIGTNTGAKDEDTRAWLVTDWLVRVQAPAWLQLAGITAQAAALRGLPALTSSEIATSVQSVLDGARRDGDAAGAAARAAAGEKLAPTVTQLQASATELVKRMCAVGEVAERPMIAVRLREVLAGVTETCAAVSA